MLVSEQLDRIVRARVERARAEVARSLATLNLGNPLTSEQDIVQLVSRLKTKALNSREEAVRAVVAIECLNQLDVSEPFKKPTFGLEKHQPRHRLSKYHQHEINWTEQEEAFGFKSTLV